MTTLFYLNRGIIRQLLLSFICVIFYCNRVNALAAGDYRSVASGNWSTAATWETYNGSAWVAAGASPTSANGVIEIQSGHTVTVTANVTVDQVVIDAGGTVVINSGVSFSVAKTVTPDLIINGTLDIAGTLTIAQNTGMDINSLCKLESTGTLAFGGTGTDYNLNNGGTFIQYGGTMSTAATHWNTIYGTYEHAVDGGTLPLATWNAGSTCLISGIVSSTTMPIVANLAQSFSNFTWNCPNQTSAANTKEILNTIGKDFTVISTGTGSLTLTSQGNNFVMTVGGNIYIQGGSTYTCYNGANTINVTGNVEVSGGLLSFNWAGQTSYGNISTTMNITGNLLVTGGTLNESMCDANNTSKGIGIIYLKGNMTVTGTGLVTETGYSKGQIYFNGTGTSISPQYYITTDDNRVTNTIDYIVNGGTVLRCDNYVLTGGGTFTLQSSAGLMIGHAGGITKTSMNGNVQCTGAEISNINLYTAGTVERSYSTGADYTYNGSDYQVSGDGLPSQVRDLTLNNPDNCLLTASTSSTGTIYFTSGIWIATTDTLTAGISTTTLGSVNRPSNGGWVYGYFRRWVAAAATSNILYPVGTMKYYNGANMSYTTAPASGGSIVMTFSVPVANATAGLPATDPSDGTLCSNIGYGYWIVGSRDGYGTGTFTLNLYANGFPGIVDYSQLHVVRRTGSGANWGFNGTHSGASGSNSAAVGNRTFMTGLGNWGIVSPAVNPLPIELVSFKAVRSGKNVNLYWLTASEISNAYFTIERSKDGISFTTVAVVDGAGNSTSMKSYSTIDYTPLSGLSYYRLTQTDYDGTNESFPLVSVNFSKSLPVTLFPNPSTDKVFIGYPGNIKESVTIEVSDLNGRTIMTRMENPAENNITELDPDKVLAKGIYIVRVITTAETFTQKVIIAQ